jgi:hypothetical protein
MAECIVLCRHPNGGICALNNDADEWDAFDIAIYHSFNAAERAASANPLCTAYGYQIVELEPRRGPQ